MHITSTLFEGKRDSLYNLLSNKIFLKLGNSYKYVCMDSVFPYNIMLLVMYSLGGGGGERVAVFTHFFI